MADQPASAAPTIALPERAAQAPVATGRPVWHRLLANAWTWRAASFLAVIGGWQYAANIPVSLAFPSFTETVAALFEMLVDGSLINAYGETLKPLLLGVLLCGLFAATFGIAMGLFRTVEWFSLPLFIILQSAPTAAIIPLITFIYGIGLGAKVFAVAIMSAPIIVLNSYKGIRNVSPSLLEMSRSFQASRWQQVRHVILPNASGMIFAGLRLGTAQGFTGAILAELLITPTGIGDLITYNRSVADYPKMFAAIFSIIIFAGVSINLLQKLEHRLFRPELRSP